MYHLKCYWGCVSLHHSLHPQYKNECVRLQGQLKELQEEGVAKDRKIRQLEELKVQAMEIGHELEATQEQCTKLELELAEMRRELNQREAKIRELEEVGVVNYHGSSMCLVYVCMCVCMYVCMCVCMCVCACTCVCACVCVHVCAPSSCSQYSTP